MGVPLRGDRLKSQLQHELLVVTCFFFALHSSDEAKGSGSAALWGYLQELLVHTEFPLEGSPRSASSQE